MANLIIEIFTPLFNFIYLFKSIDLGFIGTAESIIDVESLKTLYDLPQNMVLGGRWMSSTETLHVFSPEIFFFLTNTLLFVWWSVRKQFLGGTTLSEKLLYSFSVERYIGYLLIINFITLWLLIDFVGFPEASGGFMQGDSMMFQISYFTQGIKVFTLVLFSLFLYGGRLYFVKSFFFSYADLKTNKVIPNYRFLEYFLLLAYAVGFTLLLVSSAHLMGVALAMEALSFCLYLLTAFKTESKYSLEAAVKYFFYGAVVFGFFACGTLFIYLSVGGLSFDHILANTPTYYSFDCTALYLGKESILYDADKGSLFFMAGVFLILTSLIFKVGGAPFHFWVADVYEGAPYPTTAFMASIGKVGFYSILFKLCAWLFVSTLIEWQFVLLGAGALSLVIGSLGALKQKRIKRFFAYSSIVHVGFLLIALGIGDHNFISATVLYDAPQSMFITNSLISALLYLFVYVITVLLMFLVLMNLAFKKTGKPPVYFTDLQGLLIRSSSKKGGLFIVAVGLVVLLLSMAGIPPFFGFFTKFYILSVLVKYKFNFLICLVIVVTVIGAFYYLRLLKIFFFEDFSIKSAQTLADREIILLRNYQENSDRVHLYIHYTYKWTMSFIVYVSIFLVLIFPWIGFEPFLEMLQKGVLSVCWMELPLSYIYSDFVNYMLPYALPHNIQYVHYLLAHTDIPIEAIVNKDPIVFTRPITGDAIPTFYQYVTFLGNLWRGDHLLAQLYNALYLPKGPSK